MYDMPPMQVRHFTRRIPSTGETWDRFGVVVYMTNRHIFIFDASTSKANRLERKPILGAFELQRCALGPVCLTEEKFKLCERGGDTFLSDWTAYTRCFRSFEIVHQRVDDMLMYPVPLNNIKGYSLDVSTESHAIATLDKLRNKNCLLLAILASALAALCFLVGRFEDHPDLVVAGT